MSIWIAITLTGVIVYLCNVVVGTYGEVLNQEAEKHSRDLREKYNL